MPRTYRAGLIGCGRMGATIDDEVTGRPHNKRPLPYSHAAAVAACDRTELVAVADVAREKAEPPHSATVPVGATPTTGK